METKTVQKSTKALQAAEDTALQRYQWIAPLLEEGLNPSERAELRRKTAEMAELSVRSMYRYEELYKKGGFKALFPNYKEKTEQKEGLPDNYDDLILKVAALRLENPNRSIERCIFILENEGEVPEGVLKRSTVQRRMQQMGYSHRQIRKQAENKSNSSARHQKPHRMMMLQADYKDGPKLPIGKNGAKTETHLLVIIDDCTRYVVHSAFYLNETEENVEMGLRDAITRYGLFDRYYTDNGSCFISTDLKKALGRLGITHTKSRPHKPKGRGKVEKFNQMADVFIDEVKLDNPRTLEELNAKWTVFMEAYYHGKSHEGLPEQISPRTAWESDSRALRFPDHKLLAEAFLRRANRVVDNSGCISFKGNKYEVGLPLISQKVEVIYDPLYLEDVEIRYGTLTPFKAGKLQISSWVNHPKELEKPESGTEVDHSRFLKVLETMQAEVRQRQAAAISFGDYRKEGGDNV